MEDEKTSSTVHAQQVAPVTHSSTAEDADMKTAKESENEVLEEDE